jgi:hypothetical protein
MSRLNPQGHCLGADIDCGAALPSDSLAAVQSSMFKSSRSTWRRFKSFKPFNRFASFKPLRQFKVQRFNVRFKQKNSVES